MPTPAHPLLRHLDSRDSDRELLQRYATGGDEDAFARLVDRHGELVRRICVRVLGDAHLADDAFQATFLLLARKAGSLADADAVGSWLFGVARRISLATRRRQGRRWVPLTIATTPTTSGERSDPWGLLALLEEELARLPERLRAPLIACYLEGQTQDEAARSLGWAIATFRRRLDEARELLRSRLLTRGSAGPALLLGGAIPTATVPEVLRAAVLSLAAGGPVPASVAVLLGGTSTGWSKGLLGAVGMVLFVGLGFAAILPSAPPPVAAPVAVPGLAAPGEEPLPEGAVARLGTMAFRHGTSGVLKNPDGHGIDALAFQPDGTLVSAGGECVRFWEPETGRELHRDRPQILTRLRMNARPHFRDGGRRLDLLDATDIGTPLPSLTVWDLDRHRTEGAVHFADHPTRGDFFGPQTVAQDSAAFADLTPGERGRVRVWNADGTPRATLDTDFAHGTPLFLLPGGSELLTVEARQRIRVWNTHSGKVVRAFGDNLPTLAGAALSPDGHWLVTAGRGEGPEPFLRVWNVPQGQVARELPWPRVPPRARSGVAITFAADSSAVAAIVLGDTALLHFGTWDLGGEGASFWQAPARGLSPAALALDATRHRLAMSAVSVVRLFDTYTGREFGVGDVHDRAIKSLRFDTTDRIESVDQNDEARIWDAVTGQLLGMRAGKRPSQIRAVLAIDAVREVVSVGKQSHNLDAFALLGARPAHGRGLLDRAWPAGAPPLVQKGFDLTPDERYLAITFVADTPTPTERGRVAVFDCTEGKLVWQRPLDQTPTEAVRFAPEGNSLAVGTSRVHLFNAATGATLASFRGHRGAITALAFRPDGRRLASGSADTTVLVWACPGE
jgi:RNA polymerase sigma factor (sigma-70 family)